MNEMSRCKLCGKGGLFTKTDEYGMCSSCHKKFVFYIPRMWQVYQESLEITKTSKNIETRVSRAQTIIDSLNEIKNFGHGVDVLNIIDPKLHLDWLLNLHKDGYNELIEIRNDFDSMILGYLSQAGEASKKQIADFLYSKAIDAGSSVLDFPFDINKMLPEMLKRLEAEEQISKEKRGNKYIYSIN